MLPHPPPGPVLGKDRVLAYDSGELDEQHGVHAPELALVQGSARGVRHLRHPNSSSWDVICASGRGGIRLDWEERKGWYYALLGLNSHDVLLCTVWKSQTFGVNPDHGRCIDDQ